MGKLAWRVGNLVVCAFVAFVLAGVGSAYSAVIFQDDFSSGGFDRTNGGAQWVSKVNVEVASTPSLVAANSAKFTFNGSSDLSEDAFAELRFDLGALYKELWIQFNLYVPENYYHRDSPSTDNNKVLRLWPNEYTDNEKIGLSAWKGSNGGSSMIADWSAQGRGIGPKGETYSSFITPSDRGSWVKLKVHVIAASSSSTPGSIRVWKNDELVVDNYQVMDSFYSGEPHAYRYGYLLGWSNSGFNETTSMYIDGIIFATKESDLQGIVDTASPPLAPEMQVE
mgnify:CR=1 FL=1